ncbi:TPA: ead/Ea22-like family protein [Escherichia coli]
MTNKIDYQELREIAEKTKIAGEAPVMPFDQQINALNDFMKHFSPDIALALLDEVKRLEDTNIDAMCRISELETILATLVAENTGLRHVMTTSIEHENVEIEQTAGRPRFKLKGKDRLIADLRKQRAEWIRKALRYSEERAALAKRIEEMVQANTRQDANINHQQEGVT